LAAISNVIKEHQSLRYLGLVGKIIIILLLFYYYFIIVTANKINNYAENEFGDEGAKTISEILRRNKTIKALKLACKIFPFFLFSFFFFH